MRKILALIAMMLSAFGVYAGDSYLYWMLDADETEPIEFAYARIAAEDADGGDIIYLAIGNNPEASGIVMGDSPHTTALPELYSKLPENPAELRIFIELYNAQSEIVGISQKVTYAQLWNDHYIYQDMSTAGARAPYHFSAPEPTGGILFLIGLGVLALRRKRIGEAEA